MYQKAVRQRRTQLLAHFANVLRETNTLSAYDDILAKRKNKAQETLSTADKLLLAVEQEFEQENPIRTASTLEQRSQR
jgi:hypothetical protein